MTIASGLDDRDGSDEGAEGTLSDATTDRRTRRTVPPLSAV